MRLQRVRIENYRSIKGAEFEPSQLCALIGGNNTGKSNILKAIDLVLGESWPSVRRIADHDFFGYDETRDIHITLWFDAQRTVRGDVGEPVPYTGIRFTCTRYKRASGKHKKGDLKTVFVCVNDDGQPVQILKRPNPNARPFPTDAPVGTEIRESLPTVMVDVDRNAKFHLSAGRWSILGRMLRAISRSFKEDKERFQAFKEKFDEARTLLHTEQFRTLQSKLVEHLQAHTGLTGVEVALDEIDPLNIYKSFSILFKDPETPEFVDAEHMGSGIQSAMVISLLQAYRELHKQDAILLFEEPELFLHPHGRRHLFRLLGDLSNDGTQIIYTTHSQDFVDLERLDCVRLTTKTVDEGTKVSAPTAGVLTQKWREKLKVVKHFSSPRNEVFFADSVILVEGSADIGALRTLAVMMPICVRQSTIGRTVVLVFPGGRGVSGAHNLIPMPTKTSCAQNEKTADMSRWNRDGYQILP